MMHLLLTDTVDLIRRNGAGETNAYGETVSTFAEAVSSRARIERGGGTETDGGDRDAAVHQATLILPGDTVLEARDRVVHDGVTWEVDGPPHLHRTPRGPSHVEATLRHVEGA